MGCVKRPSRLQHPGTTEVPVSRLSRTFPSFCPAFHRFEKVGRAGGLEFGVGRDGRFEIRHQIRIDGDDISLGGEAGEFVPARMDVHRHGGHLGGSALGVARRKEAGSDTIEGCPRVPSVPGALAWTGWRNSYRSGGSYGDTGPPALEAVMNLWAENLRMKEGGKRRRA